MVTESLSPPHASALSLSPGCSERFRLVHLSRSLACCNGTWYESNFSYLYVVNGKKSAHFVAQKGISAGRTLKKKHSATKSKMMSKNKKIPHVLYQQEAMERTYTIHPPQPSLTNLEHSLLAEICSLRSQGFKKILGFIAPSRCPDRERSANRLRPRSRVLKKTR